MKNTEVEEIKLKELHNNPSKIIEQLNALNEGEYFVIKENHSPELQLLNLIEKHDATINVEYVNSGPNEWEIKVTKAHQREQTIGEIVSKDFRSAEIFKKYKIDFCCGGKKTLAQVCLTKGINILEVQNELKELELRSKSTANNYADWSLDFLTKYIVNTHHHYVKNAIPILLDYTRKIAKVHGIEHPELISIAEQFNIAATELNGHMLKEEMILFPYIEQLAILKLDDSLAPSFKTIQNPIRMMEHEHEEVGIIFSTIRQLSNDYTPPLNACTTYRVTFQKLNEFEQDLHQHIHLENNILFPRSIELENNRNI